MTEIILLVLGIAILLYVLLGGADLGAGIVEIFTGKKGIDTISKAIAPVWEANHIWLILAIVILFNGFPLVYITLTTYLHIPVFIILLGIIFRGTAFIFRYYDTLGDIVQWYYTWLFRLSSVVTPFFLGIILGAIILGQIPPDTNGTFYQTYVSPWFNWFTAATGVFITLLFGWLAAIYLTGEVKEEDGYNQFAKTSHILLILLIFSGMGVFLAGELTGLNLFARFLKSAISIVCVIVATLLIPILLINVKRRNSWLTRFIAEIQTACILVGWFAVQFPVMIFIKGGTHLTVWNTQAPDRTLVFLFYSLLVGIVLILPAFAFLFRIFKFDNKEKKSEY